MSKNNMTVLPDGSGGQKEVIGVISRADNLRAGMIRCRFCGNDFPPGTSGRPCESLASANNGCKGRAPFVESLMIAS